MLNLPKIGWIFCIFKDIIRTCWLIWSILLRTFWASILKILRTFEPQPKFTCSYKKKVFAYKCACSCRPIKSLKRAFRKCNACFHTLDVVSLWEIQCVVCVAPRPPGNQFGTLLKKILTGMTKNSSAQGSFYGL